jgi:hypothetical protein
VKTSYIHFGMGVLLCLACDQERKESQLCVDSRAAARTAAAAGEADETKRQLNVAKSECGEASAYDIDRIERQLQRLLRRQQQVAASNERRGPLGPFMDWVASQREEEDRKRGTTECAPRRSEAFGFCTSSLPQNNRASFAVEYLESRPDDVLLRLEFPTASLYQNWKCIWTGTCSAMSDRAGSVPSESLCVARPQGSGLTIERMRLVVPPPCRGTCV